MLANEKTCSAASGVEGAMFSRQGILRALQMTSEVTFNQHGGPGQLIRYSKPRKARLAERTNITAT